MKRYDLLVVGAGPAGLSVAIEAAKCGLKVAIFDENERPGGQLFKQIHKFFGSKEHKAKIRGFNIGKTLLEEAAEAGVEVHLKAVVLGLYEDNEITVRIEDEIKHIKGNAILIATGASENMIQFPGWTLPGVIGAGAAQTMMNLHHTKPGEKILMLGSGNVGLVVSYQLMQAGCEVVALVDAAPRIGGYGVHAAKVARCGVPFYLSHTIVEAEGEEYVTGVTIAQVGPDWKTVPGTEKHFDVDTICLAVGLSPMSQLLRAAGCQMVEDPRRGGVVPVCDEFGETSINGVYVAGDVSGIEEASSAMIEGRISGVAIAESLGYIEKEERDKAISEFRKALESLRQGMFGPDKKGKPQSETEEGIPLSMNLLEKGYIEDEEVTRYPGVVRKVGIHPVMECSQNIPCNPCQDACPKGCITIGENITSLPIVNPEAECIGCGMCVASCSGQAIFLLKEETDYTEITMPYEFLPLPEKGEKGMGLGRNGQKLCEAEVVLVRSAKAFDHTTLLTVRVPAEYGMKVRFFKRQAGGKNYD